MNANRKIFVLLALVLIFCVQALSQSVPKKNRSLPYKYGQSTINSARGKSLTTVVFEHWIRRSMFTCRISHVDIGFPKRAGATDINAAIHHRGSKGSGSKEVVAMKILVEMLVIILLAVPVALLIIFNAPGLGAILAMVLVAVALFVKAHRASATGKPQEMQQNKNAASKKAA
jgi:hypothetical protein